MQKEETIQGEVEEKKSVLTSIFVGVVGALSTVYLLNPTAGFFELIPDNIPIVGNLDEAAAAALVVSCLAYFGVDIGGLFGRKKKKEEDIIDIDVEDR